MRALSYSMHATSPDFGARSPSGAALAALRARTGAAHDGLHGHPALTGLVSGAIDHAGYVRLLQAWLGFHQAHRHSSNRGAVYCARLRDDLGTLGAKVPAEPFTVIIPPSDAAAWGTDYVLRGSAMGGLVMARQLDALLGVPGDAGRRFLLGDGAASAGLWRDFLTGLNEALTNEVSINAACVAAAATFDRFEQWMDGALSASSGGR